ncbi:uncharacterized protein LOC141652341 [Silene latifolia]|uniref:uncharacterized protein LOC141652341 n=1 Tax=Silene latifolia TaxID=37657 RepID=UPI003D782F10
MEYFMETKYVRLKSLHNKYLVATENGESIKQSRIGNTIQAYWAVETVISRPNLICLRSYLGKLLTASDKAFLLGWTGDKAVQSSGSDSDPSVLWEPVRDHSFYIRLRTPVYDKFLRANGGGPPWRNSVTVDMPECAVTHEWILWSIETLDDEVIDIDLRNSESKKMCSSSSLEIIDQSVYTEGSTPSSFVSRDLSYMVRLPIYINSTLQIWHTVFAIFTEY